VLFLPRGRARKRIRVNTGRNNRAIQIPGDFSRERKKGNVRILFNLLREGVGKKKGGGVHILSSGKGAWKKISNDADSGRNALYQRSR